MNIRTYDDADRKQLLALWNDCVAQGEVLYRPLTEQYLENKFLSFPNILMLVAEEKGKFAGFVIGCKKYSFLPGEDEGTPAYLSVIMVEKAFRRRGIGSALLAAFERHFVEQGKKSFALASNTPINLDWVIPGTPGHEHNNMPGLDVDCAGYPFLLKHGYVELGREVSLYLNLSEYQKSADVEEKRARLASEGIIAGRYDVSQKAEFDGMCDRVKSEYWRKVLQDETSAEHPRVILAAVTEGHIVGFTGPVDKQENGRGWFTGICTDPLYEKRGIASVLFNDLMCEFIQIGAAYSSIFTGVTNHAQRLYIKMGFVPKRYFASMRKNLEG